MQTVGGVIDHFGSENIKGKFLLIKLNCKGKPDKFFPGSEIKVMCYQLVYSHQQKHLIAIDANSRGRGILSLGMGTYVVHVVNGRH